MVKMAHEKAREKGLAVDGDILEEAVFIVFVRKGDGQILSFAWFRRSSAANTVYEYINQLKKEQAQKGNNKCGSRLTVIGENIPDRPLDRKNKIARSGIEYMVIEVD